MAANASGSSSLETNIFVCVAKPSATVVSLAMRYKPDLLRRNDEAGIFMVKGVSWVTGPGGLNRRRVVRVVYSVGLRSQKKFSIFVAWQRKPTTNCTLHTMCHVLEYTLRLNTPTTNLLGITKKRTEVRVDKYF